MDWEEEHPPLPNEHTGPYQCPECQTISAVLTTIHTTLSCGDVHIGTVLMCHYCTYEWAAVV